MKETYVSYDQTNERLVYSGPKSDSKFWDAHWNVEDFRKAITSGNAFVVNQTKRFLPTGSRILEGGCGRANTVWGLRQAGFAACGIDFAEATVDAIRSAAPELDIVLGDVRELPFDNGSFDGYWSLGVIEHFYDGYDDILAEMARVIRPGGYVFLTVPIMSRLRRAKAVLGLYPAFKNQPDIKEYFYQFALPYLTTISDFEKTGFTLIEHKGMDAVKGIKDEIQVLRPWLQSVYDNPTRLNGRIRQVVERCFASLANHISYCVFQRNNPE